MKLKHLRKQLKTLEKGIRVLGQEDVTVQLEGGGGMVMELRSIRLAIVTLNPSSGPRSVVVLSTYVPPEPS